MQVPEIGVAIVDLMLKAGWCKSKTEARKLISQGGVVLAGTKIQSPFARLLLRDGRYLLLDAVTPP